jgi:hypothetical protein
MIKPDSLRAALTAALPQLARDPESLLVFIDTGRIVATYAPGLSYEYQYTLNIILTDYAGDPDAVMIPLLQWVRTQQIELLDNPDDRQDGITFESDILANDKLDLSLKLRLTERVIVADDGAGTLTATHAPEPQPDGPYPPQHWQLYLRDQLVAEWDAP